MYEHECCGRGTKEDGPDYPDCEHRGTDKQGECAKAGCGFCIAATCARNFDVIIEDQ